MSSKAEKYALEKKRRRLRRQGWDLDLIDQVRLQRLRERSEWEEERETGDIYDDEQRGEMLKANGITAAENAFMQGRKKKPKMRKRPTHKDTISVQLAEDEYTED